MCKYILLIINVLFEKIKQYLLKIHIIMSSI